MDNSPLRSDLPTFPQPLLLRLGRLTTGNRKDFLNGIMASFIVKPEFTEVDFNRMRDSILSLELLTLNIVVLTPLPGSELYEEMKNKIIIKNFDFYDFSHPVIPTLLPIKEFYEKIAWIYESTLPMEKMASLIKKLPKNVAEKLNSDFEERMKKIRSAHESYKNYPDWT